MPRTNPWRDRALVAEARYDDLLGKYHELVARTTTAAPATPRTTAIVHAPPPSDEVKAKTRDVEAAVHALAGDIQAEHPSMTTQGAVEEARRLIRIARGEDA